VLRALSPMRRGFLEAFLVALAGTLLLAYASVDLIPHPPGHLFDDLAQIGATLLVADVFQTGWLLQNSPKRGADRENWVGIAAGLTSCALVGIFISLLLADHEGSYTWIERIGIGWITISLGLLALLIALQPLTTYEWVHQVNTEYPDD
jgi:hypothetical protein